MENLVTKMLFPFMIFLIYFKDVAAKMHITQMKVPPIISTGEVTWLECDWATDGDDKLYAIKWYFGIDEFYRWSPSETPQMKTFPIDQDPISVDLKSSYQGKIRVTRLALEAAGVYRCEVSAEGPSFHTASRTSNMIVVDFPDSKPLITGIQPSYQAHEEVRLNCSSPLSNPKANLTFYVNGDKADDSWLIPYKSIEDYPTGLETAVLGLRFLMWPHLIIRGKVNIKCTAELFHVYKDSSETIIYVDIPYQASVMEGRASSASRLLATGIDIMTMARLSVMVTIYLVL